MKIAQIVSTFPPYKGGIGNVAYNYAKGLFGLGHQVTVFVPRYHQTELNDKSYPFKIDRIKPLITSGNAAFVPHLYFKLKQFDIINLHYPFFGGCEPVLLGKILGRKTKLILSYHMDSIVPPDSRRYAFSFYNRYIVPQIVKKADCVLVSSLDYIKHSQIGSWYQGYPSKFEELPHGTDTSLFHPYPIRDFAYQKYNLSRKDKFVLFVGGLAKTHYFKGVGYLIKSFAKITQKIEDAKLVIVGNGDLQPMLQKFCLSRGLRTKVKFINDVSNEELADLYNISCVSVLPSINQAEAFGLVLIESMACAKPVIASNLPGVRTVVDDGVNGFLVPPKDVEALTNKIEILLKNKGLSHRFGENGRKKVEKQYTWPTIILKLEDICKKVAKLGQ